MQLRGAIGGLVQDIEAKKYSIWIGISLGNAFFKSSQNISKLIRWSLDHTKDTVVIVIPDRLQAINYEVTEGKSKLSAFRKAFRIGRKKFDEIQGILAAFSQDDQRRVVVLPWKLATETKYHEYRTEVLLDEFENNPDFRKVILAIIKENFISNPRIFSDTEYQKLSEYLLREIPLFLNGVYYNEVIYECCAYPGLGKFDLLIQDLQTGVVFSDLSQKLKIHTQTILADVS